MAAELRKKTIVRRGQRNVVEKRLKEVEDSLAVVATGGEPDRVAVAQLKLGLEKKLQTLKHLDEEVLALIDDETEVVADIEEADTYTQRIYQQLVRIDTHFDSVASAATRGVATTPAAGSVQAKLPKLKLPVFNGEVTEWPTFWDSYEVAVHKIAQLPNVQKFTYLRTLVIGVFKPGQARALPWCKLPS